MLDGAKQRAKAALPEGRAVEVLCVTNYFPVPADMGGAIRVLGLVRGLATRHQVHLLVPCREDTTPEHIHQATVELGCHVEALAPIAEAPRGVAAGAGLWARALRTATPPWVVASRDEGLARRAAELAPRSDAVVILDDYAGIYAEAIRQAAPGVPLVADKPVVLGAAFDLTPVTRGIRGRVVHAAGRALTRSFERRYLACADAAVVTSPEESERFTALYGRAPDATLVSAVDLPERVPPHAAGPRVIGWLGALDGAPPYDGLVRFVEEAWAPLGREGFELHIAGRGERAGLRALERHPGVRIVGYVDSVDSFLSGLSAAVIPLWGGQGVKLKTLTLLGAGLPVAATPMALEGIPAEHGIHCMRGDDPLGLADALRQVAGDPQLEGRLREGSRSLVESRFTWEQVAGRFTDLVEQTAGAKRHEAPVAQAA
jgi:glycosyltransferase involved in cell wall biosynthesis